MTIFSDYRKKSKDWWVLEINGNEFVLVNKYRLNILYFLHFNSLKRKPEKAFILDVLKTSKNREPNEKKIVSISFNRFQIKL